jgi:TctA family transporter
MSRGSPTIFITRPISGALLAAAAAFVAYSVWASRRRRQKLAPAV